MNAKRHWKASMLLYVALFTAVAALLINGIWDAQQSADAQGLRIAQSAVQRAAVACYATEGRYPQDYNYLRQRYGVQVDEEKYIVHYEIFAENIMPDITVTERMTDAWHLKSIGLVPWQH